MQSTSKRNRFCKVCKLLGVLLQSYVTDYLTFKVKFAKFAEFATDLSVKVCNLYNNNKYVYPLFIDIYGIFIITYTNLAKSANSLCNPCGTKEVSLQMYVRSLQII